jgi:eukaryotic-like serine/threonine-protein kinase
MGESCIESSVGVASKHASAEEFSAGALKEQLELILNSEAFTGAWRQRRLLQYLVEQCIQGRANDLKEYSVGVEVFEKGEDFDPRLSPIVRVEVSRLRTRLGKYYEGPGRGDRIRIDLPRGGYAPQISEWREDGACSLAGGRVPAPQDLESAPADAVAAMPAPRQTRSWRFWLACSAASALALLGAGELISVVRNANAPATYAFSRITPEQARCNTPSLSPDGRFVAYSRRAARHSDIYIRRLAGEDARNLTPGSTGDNWQPSYSPDGSQIAFRGERDSGGIFLVSAAGGEPRRLASAGYHPAWSPDGKRVYFSSQTFFTPEDGPYHRGGELFVVDAAGGAPRQLTSAATVFDAVQPSCSPHGQRIAFWMSGPNGNRDLWTIPVNAVPGKTQATALTNDRWVDWNPVWSPDGRYIYFVSDRDGAMNLWRIRVDEATGKAQGAPEPVHTPSAYTAEAALSRDGDRIVYVNRQISSTVFRAQLDLAHGGDQTSAVAFTTSGDRFREPRVSPDGAWIAVRVQNPGEDIALIRPDGSGLRRLTNDEFKDRTPHWAPDGSYIEFLSNRGGTFEHWAIRPDGTGLRRLAGGVSLAWWPDGSLLSFARGGKVQMVEPAGRPLDLRGVPEGFIPTSWSPDAKYVVGRASVSDPNPNSVYSPANRSLWKYDENGTFPLWLKDGDRFLFQRHGEIRLADARSRTTRPALTFTNGATPDSFAISKDERTLFFVVTEINDSVWMAERR